MTMRAPGRALRSVLTISRPLPSARRRSTTAKAGALPVTAATPDCTLSAVATMKPRRSMARASRWQSGASSSTISRLRSESGQPSSIEGPGEGVCASFIISMPSLQSFLHRDLAVHSFERAAPPLHDNLCAAIRQIAEAHPRAGALEQALGDEDAEPHMLLGPAASPGNIGLADARENRLREARTIIDDVDRHRILAPGGGDVDFLMRELRRVLDEVAEPVHDFGAARHQRLLDRPPVSVAAGGGAVEDALAVDAIGLARRFDQRRERHARREGRAGLGVALPGEIGENGAAALAL